MYRKKELPAEAKQEFYRQLAAELDSLLAGETDPVANMANTAALLYDQVPQINWVGFYLYRDGELVLGPFQGKPACVRIQLGRGVCGTAFSEDRIQRVNDVHTFPGHIACDAESRSELVLPFGAAGIRGVLDVDSPLRSRFDVDDEAGFAACVDVFCRYLC